MSRFRITLAVLVVAAGGLLAAPPAQANGGQTFDVTSPSMCGGAGTFEQAVKDANASPGTDTIQFAAGLTVSASPCATTAGPEQFPIQASEAVDIVGNGATIVGDMYWVDFAGRVNNFLLCPSRTANSHWIQKSTGFLAAGVSGHDNTGVAVSVSGLSFDGLPEIAVAYENASLTLADSSATNIMSFNEDCTRGAISGFAGADVTLRNVRITESYAPGMDTGEGGTGALISGVNGDLVLDGVFLGNNWQGRAVTWQENQGTSSVKVFSSRMIDSGGLSLDSTTSAIVNSAFMSQDSTAANRVTGYSGATTIKASTFYWTEPVCQPNCGTDGMGFWLPGAGTIDFQTTAVGADATYPNSGPLLFGDTTKFTSDALTWIQQTANQSNAALMAILPQVMTTHPGLSPTGQGVSWVDYITPMLGTALLPGVLIDAVPGADCPGGVNELRSPLDNSCVTSDVLGNPRWDAGNQTRNIGAVQNVQSPHLAIDIATPITATSVPLVWNRPPDPLAGPITGYLVYYVPVAGGQQQTFPVQGADVVAAVIPGLTPGTPYVFSVAGVTDQGAGTTSNAVTETPISDVEVPQVSAVGGDTQVVVSWTEPALNGHPGPLSYFVQYRKVGELAWVNGPGNLSGRTTVIPGLTNGTPYEFAVTAAAADGSASPQIGTATATPYGAIGTPVPTATPGNGKVGLTWPVPSTGGRTITGYRVYYRVWGSSAWRGFTTVASPSAVVTGLTNGRKYAFGVVAVAADGAHSAMGMTGATPMATLPLAVTGTRPAGNPLPRTGSTLVVGAATTSSQGTIQTRVRCAPVGVTSVRGDLRYCRATVGANGAVTITTFGYRGVRVTVTQQAVPRPGQTGYMPSVVWTRSWGTTG